MRQRQPIAIETGARATRRGRALLRTFTSHSLKRSIGQREGGAGTLDGVSRLIATGALVIAIGASAACSLTDDLIGLNGSNGASTSSSEGAGSSGGGNGGSTAAGGEGGSGPGECPDNLQACGGECVDTATTNAHCGMCDYDCGLSSCEDGFCVLAKPNDGARPLSLAVDSDHLYVGHYYEESTLEWGSIERIQIAGGATDTFYENIFMVPVDLELSPTQVFGVGSAMVLLLDRAQPTLEPSSFFATEQGPQMCIAVAEPYVYWARTLLEGANSPAIMTALVNDPAPSSVVLVDNITGPQCIATDPANVYWTTDRGLVQKWSLIDRELETLANDDEQGLSGIAVSSDHVYYLSPAALRRVPIDGGAPETLAKNLVRGSRVAVDDAHAYFTSLGDDETAGSLSRVALDGGPDDVEVLYTSQGTLGGKTNAEMWDLELDDSSVYATDFGGARVVKRAKAANSPQ